MADAGLPDSQQRSLYRRVEERLLLLFPDVITPLRFRILVGYVIVLLLGVYGWEQIASAWRYLATLLAPVAALLGALLALKLSVVFVSVVTLFSALLKVFFGFLMVVLKPGILKAIFVPQLVSLLSWFHRKSTRLQAYVKKMYDRIKAFSESVIVWWKNQSSVDKTLLSGFLVPLLVILLIVFVVKRAIAIFAVKKITEQVVQKSTKFIIKYFHRVPIVGGLPASIASRTRKLTVRDDRDDVIKDLKLLGKELYEPEGTTGK